MGEGAAPVTAELARRLLPALTRAVLLAAAGSDRYEILTADGDAVPALCVNCNQGSAYDQEVTISSRCVEHGHEPFGQPGGAPWPSGH